MGKHGENQDWRWRALAGLEWGQELTLDGEEHGLADVGAHTVAGLAEVVADVLFQDVAYQQGAVGQDLDAASEGHWVILLGVPAPWKEVAVRGALGAGVTRYLRKGLIKSSSIWGHFTAELHHPTVLAPHSSYCTT